MLLAEQTRVRHKAHVLVANRPTIEPSVRGVHEGWAAQKQLNDRDAVWGYTWWANESCIRWNAH